jgi:DnaJ-class molecular chaperone
MDNLYERLNIEEHASSSEIKLAYKLLAKVHHPDKGGNTGDFQKIQEAYDVLSCANKRYRYDRGEDVLNQKDEETVVKEKIAQIFVAAVAAFKDDYQYENIFDAMRTECESAQEKMTENIKMLNHEISLSREIAERISGDKQEFFHGVLNNQITKAEENINNLNKEIELAEKCLEFISKIDYTTEENYEYY